MILVIFAICVGLIFLATWIEEKSFDLDEVSSIVVGVTGILGIIISVIVALFLLIDVAKLGVIDDRIAMYQEENAKIEQQIATIVQNYQDYETDIFDNISTEDAMVLVGMYPELKSDTLVQSQIYVYVENNQKIKELREEQIMGDVSRWWLYFG